MDELVKVLRETDFSDGCPCGAETLCQNKDCVILQAADAIEAMSEYVNTMRRLKCEGWHLQQTKFHDGYHAVSTMPLPEPPEEA